MNVVDSSGWLEYFADGPNRGFFSEAVEDVERLLVPTISICEVYKIFLRRRGEQEALRAMGAMRGGQVIDLDFDLALESAKLGAELELPLADSIILATARRYNATLWTQDGHFSGLEGVRYIPRVSSGA